MFSCMCNVCEAVGVFWGHECSVRKLFNILSLEKASWLICLSGLLGSSWPLNSLSTFWKKAAQSCRQMRICRRKRTIIHLGTCACVLLGTCNTPRQLNPGSNLHTTFIKMYQQLPGTLELEQKQKQPNGLLTQSRLLCLSFSVPVRDLLFGTQMGPCLEFETARLLREANFS